MASFAGTSVKAPAKVQNVTVSVNNQKGNSARATVSWKKIKELKKNTSGYAVYVKTSNGKWRRFKRVGKGISKVSKNISLKKNNYFKVRAYKKYKSNGKTKYKYGPYSKTVKVKKDEKTGKAMMYIPVGRVSCLGGVFTDSSKQANIKLTWDPAEKATHYEIFRAYGDGSFEKIATTTERSYTDNSFYRTQSVSYRVRGLGTNEETASSITIYGKGSFSNVVTLQPQDIK